MEVSPELVDQVQGSDTQKPERPPPVEDPGSKSQGRRRTKTGCLTCRKRRIKCGEESPICHNCIKSRRMCEGYSKILKFKEPFNGYRTTPTAAASHSANARIAQLQGPPEPPIRTSKVKNSSKSQLKSGNTTPSLTVTTGTSSVDNTNRYAFQKSVTQDNYPQARRPSVAVVSTSDTVDRSHIPEASFNQVQIPHGVFNHQISPIKQEQVEKDAQVSVQSLPNWSAGSSSASFSAAQKRFQDANQQFPASSSATFYQSYPTPQDWTPPGRAASVSDHSMDQRNANVQARTHQPRIYPNEHGQRSTIHQDSQSARHEDSSYPQLIGSRDRISSLATRYMSREEEEEEDPFDPFDVSDEDTLMEEDDGFAWQEVSYSHHIQRNDLGIQVVGALLGPGQRFQDLHPRSITSFIDRPDMLATYAPSIQSSPLNDPMTARIFCHFVNVTGPCISMFERNPANPSLIFQGQPVPSSQHHIWTYTFPTLALQNPALLHAMLAMASLHIAKLQNGPVTASLKHYAISLRRVGKLLNLPSRRKQPATLAAAQLLAFYECWCADHQKWSNHVLGARQLVREIDFVGMTRQIKRIKYQRREEQRMMQHRAQSGDPNDYNDDGTRYQAYTDDVDENIIGRLMGTQLRYDEFGQVLEDHQPEDESPLSERDIEQYELQRDLFWWYCKQDAYQSVLGGGRLFMEYNLWSHCPPRAPIGRLHATYGTYDHLILLFGRLASFASKDLKRKRLAMKANGGWRPPEAMQARQQAQGPGPEPPTNRRTPPGGPPPMPGFSGMYPDVHDAEFPMGFAPQNTSGSASPHSSGSEEVDLAIQFAEAEEEWADIHDAFGILEQHFGEDFQALEPEFSTPIQTPFGPALQYRTYGIAGIWMNFYMALIVCHRAHPCMPPAAMMAAGIAARQTADYASRIARIALGIAPEARIMELVNPSVGAALIESTTALFVAGVQVQTLLQRATLIIHLHHIARLTGWQTALAIANGCETSWLKSAEFGSGPPHTRFDIDTLVSSPTSMTDARLDIWDTGRRIDRALAGRTQSQRVGMLNEGGRVHYALGVLGVESDFEGLEMGHDDDGIYIGKR
ncbi:hypothetical protein BJ875DRAFT_177734 [Amylocarpus encephaloides]|uniref:Zn(2)-C6 fungal-type domain-containing protein n=1 Tax=Amylocarpus encephaloides TaxID=45428 RepID=A0A9P7YAJ2_9HELO|nr:hypothetical protein BJ875DRAFT_177734 [Amylocarpus encephaloides]